MRPTGLHDDSCDGNLLMAHVQQAALLNHEADHRRRHPRVQAFALF